MDYFIFKLVASVIVSTGGVIYLFIENKKLRKEITRLKNDNKSKEN